MNLLAAWPLYRDGEHPDRNESRLGTEHIVSDFPFMSGSALQKLAVFQIAADSLDAPDRCQPGQFGEFTIVQSGKRRSRKRIRLSFSIECSRDRALRPYLRGPLGQFLRVVAGSARFPSDVRRGCRSPAGAIGGWASKLLRGQHCEPNASKDRLGAAPQLSGAGPKSGAQPLPGMQALRDVHAARPWVRRIGYIQPTLDARSSCNSTSDIMKTADLNYSTVEQLFSVSSVLSSTREDPSIKRAGRAISSR